MGRTLIGRCGKFCGECTVYLVTRVGDKAAREKVAAELNTSPDRVRCEGCQARTPECYGYGCKVTACLDERGYRYCAQCAEINDCTKYARLNAEFGGRPKIQSNQLRAWGEERWLKYHLGQEDAGDG